ILSHKGARGKRRAAYNRALLSQRDVAVAFESPEMRDGIVAAVAFAIGAFALAAALWNFSWPYQLRKIQWIDERYGRRAARLAWALIGLAMLALGAAIALGWNSPRAAVEWPARTGAFS